MFNFATDGVTRCLHGEGEEITDEHLRIIIDKFNLKLTKKVDMIEVCLSVLAIISWTLPQHKGLQVLYDQFM